MGTFNVPISWMNGHVKRMNRSNWTVVVYVLLGVTNDFVIAALLSDVTASL